MSSALLHRQLKALRQQVKKLENESLTRVNRLRQEIEQREKAEARLRQLFEKSADAILIFDGGVFTDCNQAAVEMMRCANKEQLLSLHPSEISPLNQPDGCASFEKANKIIKNTLEKGSNRFEWVHRRMDGEDFWVEVLLTAIVVNGRQIIHVVWREIGDRKNAEIERDRLFNISADMLCIAGLDGYFKRINPAFEILGYTPEELLAEQFINFVHPEDVEATLAEVSKLSNGITTISFENRYRCKDGSYKWLSWTSVPDVQNGLIYATARDISSRIAAEEALRQKEQQYRSIFEATSDGLLMFDMETGVLTEANPAACRMHGYTYEEFLNLHPTQVIHPDYLHLFGEYITKVRAGEKCHIQALDIRKDGTFFDIEVTGTPCIFGGKPYVLSVMRDVSEQQAARRDRQTAEAERQRSYNILKSVIESTPDVVFVKDIEGHYLMINSAFAEVFGKSIDEVTNKVDAELFPRKIASKIRKNDLRIMNKGGGETIEEIVPKNGLIQTYLTTKSPWRDEEGNIIGIVGLARDISERKSAEKILQIKEQNLRTIFNNVYDAIFIHDVDGTILDVNDRMLEMYKVSRIEATKFSIQDDYSSEDNPVDQLPGIWERVLAGETVCFEWKTKRPLDGFIFDVEVALSCLTLNKKTVILANVRDISDRVAAQAAIAKSEAKFRGIVENAYDIIYSLSLEGNFTYASPTFTDILGHDIKDVLGQSFVPFVHPDDVPACHAYLDLIFKTGQKQGRLEFRAKRFDSSWCLMTCNVSPIKDTDGNVMGFHGIARDISDRQLAEKNQQRLIAILEATTDYVGIADANGYCIYINQAGRKMSGLELDEDISTIHCMNLVAASATEATQKGLLTAMQDGSWSGETAILHRNGEEIPGSQVIMVHKSETGEVEFISTIIRDIQERKQAEIELQHTRNFLESVLNTLPVGVVAKDALELRFVLWNPAAEKVLGLTAEQVLGKNDYDFFPKVHADFFTSKDREVLNSKKIFDIPEKIVQPATGESRILHTKKTAILDAEGNPQYLLAITEDITERKQAEEALQQSEAQLRQQTKELEKTLRELQQTQSQLLQSEKMSSLGQLVAGVAHEINNPTSFIYGNLIHAEEYLKDIILLVELYQKHYPNPQPEILDWIETIDWEFMLEDLPKLVKSMKVGAERIQKIVVSLRSFSRMDEAEKKTVNIHDGIDSTLMILEHRLKATPNSTIEIIKEYGELPLIECYAGQLNQVFMNILSNAIDALEEGHRTPPSVPPTRRKDKEESSFIIGHGKESTNYQLPKIRIRTTITDNKWVEIGIADNGAGMTETVRQRLFDPFFTTKPVGKGTGMGLSISYQIINDRHHGSLECISSLGKGAEFIIKIPLKAC